jgi:NCS1 family nucleobase:cation symporter-1
VVIALVGLAVKPLHFLYDYAWFVGFFVAGGLYLALMRMSVPLGAGELEIVRAGEDAV